MDIYFCGSIRGGRNDSEMYKTLITHLLKYGNVLTHHVGFVEPTKDHTTISHDNGIYLRDMNWLVKSDVVIAEVSTPSIGVGFELGKAEDMEKSVLCLYRKGSKRRPSPLVSGNPNFDYSTYSTEQDAFGIIDEFLDRLMKKQ
jgi:hypothetical protein